MNQEGDFVTLTKELCTSIQKRGVKATTEKLKQINNSDLPDNFEEKMLEYIIKRSAKAYSLQPEDLKTTYVKGDARLARTICFVLLKRHVGMTHQRIVNEFGGKQACIVTFALNDFKQKDPNFKPDQIFLEKFEEIDNDVKERKAKLLTNQA